MPVIAIPGASLSTHPHYFPRTQGVPEQNINIGVLGNGAFQQSQPLSTNWSSGEADRDGVQPADMHGIQQTGTLPLGGKNSSELPYTNLANHLLMVAKRWQNGDWTCDCGFHNYSSHAQCKKCNASMPPVLGTKRLASEEIVCDGVNKKRPNAGLKLGLQYAYPSFDQVAVSGGNQTTGVHPPASSPSGSLATAPNLQVNPQLPHLAAMPTLLGKGAKQWRIGDWTCTNCDNHNYASRSHCNRCKTQKDAPVQPVSIAQQ
ncbi:hypothetical protein U1Q18_011563 [Sarracenia purpurea var. burkii]